MKHPKTTRNDAIMESNARTFGLIMLSEAGLGFLGVSLAWLAGVPIHQLMVVTPEALERGLIATVPILVCLAILIHSRWSPLENLKRQVETIVQNLFAGSSWLELALISLAAGLGEELLFRGALQPIVANWTNPLVAIVVVSLLFGLAHALSLGYFLSTAAVGCYFGWMAMAYDDLIAPIVAHGLYDFIALTYFQQRAKRNRNLPESQ